MKLKLEDKRSDIIAARDAWDADYNKLKSKFDSEVDAWDDAKQEISLFVEDQVKAALGRAGKDLQVDADFSLGSLAHVRVGNGTFANHEAPLTWSFEAILDKEGNVKKETGSWSGLNATTPEDVKKLRDIVDVLEILNNMDWYTILSNMNEKYPNWEDYVKTKVPRRDDRPNFEKDIRLLDIEDAIGKEVLVKGKPLKYDVRFSRDGSYYIIHKKTPKQVSVTECSIRQADSFKDKHPEDSLFDIVSLYGMEYNVTMDKFLNVLPQTIEVISGK